MQSGFWQKMRIGCRWIRRGVLGLIIIAIGVLIWFNQIGVPDFLKNSLVEKLRERGIELSFTRIRFRLVRGLVAENVRIGNAKIPDSPTLLLAEVQLQPDFSALLRGHAQIEGLILRDGELLLPLSPSNSLALRNIQSDLHFGANGTWSLDNFKADFSGAKLALSGDVVHAPELRDWSIFQGAKAETGKGNEWRNQLQKISDALKKIHSTRPPQLTLLVNGDAQRPESFIVKVQIALGKTHLQLDGGENDITQNFRWRARGAIEPEIVRPFLTESNAIRGLNDFTFAEPLALDANFYGRDFGSLGANGSVALTNFTVHDEAVDHVAGDFIYTNRMLELFQPHLACGKETMTADEIDLDFNKKLIWFKNGFGIADPRAVARAIGPKTGELLEPYVFSEPPTTRVNGCAPMRKVESQHDLDDADINFDIVNGGDFRCLKFHAQTVTGTIHWLGESLILTNVAAQCYGGSGNGFAIFDFSPPHKGADYQFTVSAAKLNLHLIATDWISETNRPNHLEGLLSGKVTVTRADTRDWQSVNGFGNAHLRDGLLWDIPVFGILSPVLNALLPGVNLGNSRATDAGGKFSITNGVIYSDSLEIHSTMMRLQYNGSVNLKGDINAHVVGQPLRDVPVVGTVVNIFFWPFGQLLEYKITGTLEKPKSEPIHIPKETLLLLHPLRTIEGWLPGDEFFSNTNSPAK